MKESDIKHLRWIYKRLKNYYRKTEFISVERFNPDADYMLKFKSIIDELEKENMSEEKRYRLELPDKIEKDIDPYLLKNLQKLDGEEVKTDKSCPDEDFICVILNDDDDIANITKSWLKEIPENKTINHEGWVWHILELEKSTQTYKELIQNNLSTTGQIESRIRLIIKRVAKDSLKQGGEDNELKHQETESMTESYKTTSEELCRDKGYKGSTAREMFELGWNAVLKSRGY